MRRAASAHRGSRRIWLVTEQPCGHLRSMRNDARSHGVREASEATRDAQELGLRFPVRLVNQPAGWTRPAGVARVHHHDHDA